MESRGIIPHLQEKYRDVFLSHSGRQKSFVEQLHRDLSRENVSSFLDKDPQSLPKGRPFPSRIFSNAENCKVAVLVLSLDFVSSKWPMLELSAIVKAQRSMNPDMAILPLFFKISVQTLKEKFNNHDLLSKWKELQAEDDRISCEEWHRALKEIFKFNGMEYSEDEGEVSYRDRIVDHIRLLLPPNLKYDDSLVEGKTRLCTEVADLFEKAEWRNGVKVVGLYGIAGSGKTTICKSLCNFYSRKFKGKVFHAEIQNDLKICIETQKQALKVLTDASDHRLDSVTSKEQGSQLLRKWMPYHKVFVAVDNISDASLSVEAAQSYLSAAFKEGSMILLTARSSRMLKRLLREEESLLQHVPLLDCEEAMAVLLKLTHLKLSDLTCAEVEVAKLCIMKCCFGGQYHPLALQAFGAYLFDKFDAPMLQWNEIPDFRDAMASEVDEAFSVFELSFRDLSPRHLKIFILVAVYLPRQQMKLEMALQWLAALCNERIAYICDVINNLKKKALIEEDDTMGNLRVHDLIREFAENRTKETTRPWSWCCLRGVEEVPTSLYDKLCLQGIKLTNCGFRNLPLESYNFELLANVAVLHLDNVYQLTRLNLSSMNVLKSVVIRNCGELTEIEGIEHLANTTFIEIVDCNPLLKAPQIDGLTSLRWFRWDRRKCVRWERISVSSESLREFPKLEGLTNLREIRFNDCDVVMNIPNRMTCSQEQGVLFGGCSAMTTATDLRGCSQLQIADFDGCSALATGPHFSGLSNLEDVRFRGCSAMITAPDLSGCSQLEDVWFDGCCAMTNGPNLSGCSLLQRASFQGCFSTTTGLDVGACIPLKFVRCEGPVFTALCHLQLTECVINKVIDIANCRALQDLILTKCRGFTMFPNFTDLSSLRRFTLRDCKEIINPPDLSNCGHLQSVEIRGCSSLTRFPSFAGLSALERVVLTECQAVDEPPDVSGCNRLQEIELRDNVNM